MSERRRWGKAGERLPATTMEGRRQHLRDELLRGRARYSRARDEQEARARWEAGLVVPHHITIALDVAGLYGPEVDEACGAHEPDVDRWEAGELYPSWDQLCALAELTGYPVAFFTRPAETIDAWDTTLRFHVKSKDMPAPPILAFKAGARGNGTGVAVVTIAVPSQAAAVDIGPCQSGFCAGRRWRT